MTRVYRFFKTCFYGFLTLPHLLVLSVHKERNALWHEVDIWLKVLRIKRGRVLGFVYLMQEIREFRIVLYFRLGFTSHLLNFILPKPRGTYIMMPKSNIDTGLVLQHGFSTIINARRIGRDCQIWHNVTIGLSESGTDKKPIIGDNVKVCAGAIVLGDIEIGNNSTIGAGTVLTKSIPSNSTVVGNPPFIIRIDGKRVYQKL